MIRFVIDPAFAREAVLEGRELIVEVTGPQTYRCVVGGPSKHRQAVAVAKRQAA